ncbi:MAG: J domain-containing protein [Polyangiaceae bacterium]|nr:J domain-containing protein [Polyangiaceae bacterium]
MGLLRWVLILVGAFVVVRAILQIVRPASARTRRPTARPARQLAPHEILGVEPDAPQADIQRAYRRLAREYHPDRMEGMAPELRELAERRMAEINAAYEHLRRARPEK